MKTIYENNKVHKQTATSNLFYLNKPAGNSEFELVTNKDTMFRKL